MGQWQPKKILFLRIIVSLQVCCVYCLCHSGDLTILAFCKKALNSSQILGVLSSSDFIHEIRISFPVLHILKNFINLVRRILLLLLTFLHYIYSELLLFWFLTLYVNLNQVVLCSSHYFNKLIFCSFYDFSCAGATLKHGRRLWINYLRRWTPSQFLKTMKVSSNLKEKALQTKK